MEEFGPPEGQRAGVTDFGFSLYELPAHSKKSSRSATKPPLADIRIQLAKYQPSIVPFSIINRKSHKFLIYIHRQRKETLINNS
ncbi:hypothetical protein L1987_36850 [Smallanthus sonchifolius]|uniref:Uncharacterized protein n=1 Tax=Smallanthus sonchifolius TaxID=185202 RepID=A0ACB9HFZ5_9ASTR|nr:hypothetical protein L1987_36850 [Smallanthus sonchifolius]